MRLFKTGILFVGKDYYSHALWDQYIKFEFSQQNWSSLAYIYLQVLRSPTEKLHNYYEKFKRFVAGMEEEMSQEKNYEIEVEAILSNGENLFSEKEISRIIEDLQSPDNGTVRSKAVCKYKSMGDQFYKEACMLDEEIKCFEDNIQRQYFDVTPLGDEQLKNWHGYLDFIEKQGDFTWALQLFERCLISCANYPEFWIRYVEFMESKGGRELANFALERATKIFVKDSLEIHLFSSKFKERIGKTSAARAAVMQLDMASDFCSTRRVIELANMERRLGNTKAAYDRYDKAIKMAEEKKQWDSLSSLFVHLSRLKYTITGSADAARDVLIDGIQRVPCSRVLLEYLVAINTLHFLLLYQFHMRVRVSLVKELKARLLELIKFVMMHQGASQVHLLDSIVARAISPGTEGSQGLNPKDQEDISSLFLEFVDLCGTVDDIIKATNRHVRLFPQFLRPKLVSQNLHSDNLSNEISEKRLGCSSALDQSQFENPGSKINKKEKQVHLPQVNLDHVADLMSAGHTPQKGYEKNRQKRRKKSSNQVEQSAEASTDVKVADHDLINELAKDTPGVMGSLDSLVQERREDKPGPKVTHDLVNQLAEDIPGVVGSIQSLAEERSQDEPVQMEVTPTSVHNSSGDTPAPNSLACNLDDKTGSTVVEPSEEQSSPVNVHDQEVKCNHDPVYCGKLSPNSQGKASQEITSAVSNEYDATLISSKTNRNSAEVCLNANAIPSVASPNCTPTADFPLVHQHPDEVTSDILSPASCQKHMAVEAHLNSTVTPSTGGKFQKIKHTNAIPEDGTSEIHSHLGDQHLSPQQPDVSIAASERLMTRGHLPPEVTKIGGPAEVHHETCDFQQNMFADHTCPVNVVPDQSSSPTNQRFTLEYDLRLVQFYLTMYAFLPFTMSFPLLYLPSKTTILHCRAKIMHKVSTQAERIHQNQAASSLITDLHSSSFNKLQFDLGLRASSIFTYQQPWPSHGTSLFLVLVLLHLESVPSNER
ncbi:hypothetical protein M9H77_11130 [Catharanthus roseus]|uniref:Uncharacterized protein n=1 Tax=Catharanthus roseus TaxID=4058 RepID=A0ACC0BDR2_CATRO|nr:hypothetical protein M9H77_11130 [Catharanthus roseus]